MAELLLTREETADGLRLSVRMVDNLIAHGELLLRRIGRRVLILRESVEKFARAEDPSHERGMLKSKHSCKGATCCHAREKLWRWGTERCR